VIRIMIVDDHPALRAGLQTVLQGEPGLVPVAESEGEPDFWPLLKRVRPDVVLLDYHLQRSDGLQLCYSVKHELEPPRVLLYSAHASPALGIAARVAGADGLLSKAHSAQDLFTAIRVVAKGEPALPPVPQAELNVAYVGLPDSDHSLLAMALDGATATEIAAVLSLPVERAHRRMRRLLHDLRVEVPSVC
jgi:DNA-binding NarL/FixJ family response regulator